VGTSQRGVRRVLRLRVKGQRRQGEGGQEVWAGPLVYGVQEADRVRWAHSTEV
jgi:hypothetical protein